MIFRRSAGVAFQRCFSAGTGPFFSAGVSGLFWSAGFSGAGFSEALGGTGATAPGTTVVVADVMLPSDLDADGLVDSDDEE